MLPRLIDLDNYIQTGLGCWVHGWVMENLKNIIPSKKNYPIQ